MDILEELETFFMRGDDAGRIARRCHAYIKDMRDKALAADLAESDRLEDMYRAGFEEGTENSDNYKQGYNDGMEYAEAKIREA